MIALPLQAGKPTSLDGDRHVENAGPIDARDGVAAGSDERADAERYRLISIDAARAPEGCVGPDWHVYRIAQGGNGITGYRRGDPASVRSDVEAIVTALNDRRRWASGKATSKRHGRGSHAAGRVVAK